jgi:hypothetical protein
LQQRYFLELDDASPRVFMRLTDAWLELTVRFLVGDHGVRDVKDAMARDVLAAIEAEGIEIATTTFRIIGAPTGGRPASAAPEG